MMKKKNIFCILFIFVVFPILFGCKTTKEIKESNYTELYKEISEFKNKIFELQKEVYTYRDSFQYVKALSERDKYEGTDSISDLETSYAKSHAEVRSGKLTHILQNKDSIPTIKSEITKYIEIYKTDTVIQKDTVYIYKDKENTSEKVVVKQTIWQKISDYLSVFLILLIIGYFIYSKIKK